MRICVFGAGAVGGHVAVRLALAGHQVSCVARGEHLAAMRRNGLTLVSGDARHTAKVAASDNPADLGPQDLVISGLKATGLGALAAGVAPLLGAETAVVFAQNGVPWWYGLGKAPAGAVPPRLDWLDPGGALAAAVAPERIIGGVIFSSNEVQSPGVVVNDSPERNRLVVGEIDDAASDRINMLRAALREASIDSPEADNIRQVVWSKLTGNMTVSVLCLLTGLTARAALEDPQIAAILPGLRTEAMAIADAYLPGFRPAAAAGGGGGAPNHKPSLLQDYELGRPMEVDALIRAPAAYAEAAGIAIPMLRTMGALAMRQARARGLWSPEA